MRHINHAHSGWAIHQRTKTEWTVTNKGRAIAEIIKDGVRFDVRFWEMDIDGPRLSTQPHLFHQFENATRFAKGEQ
jgi:hypothetical protein